MRFIGHRRAARLAMTKHQVSAKRSNTRSIGLALVAALTIGACGSAVAAQHSAIDAGRGQSERLRQLNETLYPDSVKTDAASARPSRLEQLNETLYPDVSETTPHNNLTPR